MGSLIKGSINLNKLPKDKLIKGKNGTYYDFTLSVTTAASSVRKRKKSVMQRHQKIMLVTQRLSGLTELLLLLKGRNKQQLKQRLLTYRSSFCGLVPHTSCYPLGWARV